MRTAPRPLSSRAIRTEPTRRTTTPTTPTATSRRSGGVAAEPGEQTSAPHGGFGKKDSKNDAQNDIVKIVDSSGSTVVEYTYDSWGKIISSTGTLANTVGLYQPFRYRGYVYDTETQWYYLQSRYYDPATCRFISADVLLSTGQGVIGHNSFAYCNNNPVVMTDDGGCVPTYNVMMADNGGGGPIVVLHCNQNNHDNVDSQSVYDLLQKGGFFDDESLGDVSLIIINQVEDTNFKGALVYNLINWAITTTAGFAILGIKGAVVGSVLGLAGCLFSNFVPPNGIYSTFNVTIIGTTVLTGIEGEPTVEYVYTLTYMYIPNGNNSQPYLYLLKSRFEVTILQGGLQ